MDYILLFLLRIMPYITPLKIVAWASSTTILDTADYKWVWYLEITNDWDNKVYLAFWTDAILWQWTLLNPGDSYSLDAVNWLDKLFIKLWCNAIASVNTNLAITLHDNLVNY